MTTQTIDLNQAACIKDVMHIGYTTYVNICSGTQTDVPWGGADWIGMICLALLIGGFGLVFIIMAVGLYGWCSNDHDRARGASNSND